MHESNITYPTKEFLPCQQAQLATAADNLGCFAGTAGDCSWQSRLLCWRAAWYSEIFNDWAHISQMYKEQLLCLLSFGADTVSTCFRPLLYPASTMQAWVPLHKTSQHAAAPALPCSTLRPWVLVYFSTKGFGFLTLLKQQQQQQQNPFPRSTHYSQPYMASDLFRSWT